MTTMKKRKVLVFGSVLATAVITGGVALAASTSNGGYGDLRRTVRYSADPTATSSVTYATVPGALVDVAVPTNRFQQVLARFTAESRCDGGPVNSYCTVRIRAPNLGTNVVRDFQPQPNLDFAFDSASTDNWESNSMARVAHLESGTWRLEAQYAVNNPAKGPRLS